MIPLRDINPTRSTPWLTYTVIGVNVAAFLYQTLLGPRTGQAFIQLWGMTPAIILHGGAPLAWATVLTSMFLHGGWLHLLSNMWFLHVFGDNVEDRLGAGHFVVFYLACGIAAAVTQMAVDPTSLVPMVGASGAVSGVLAAYMRLFPGVRVVTLIPIFFIFVVRELPAGFFLILWFVLQLLYAVGSTGTLGTQSGGVAFFAHVGGFVAGLVLLRVLDRGRAQRRRRGRIGRGPTPRVDA